MGKSLQNIILEIHAKEDKISSQSKRLLDEPYEMTLYLQDLLWLSLPTTPNTALLSALTLAK